MIAVFSAYREPPGEWERRLRVAQVWAVFHQTGAPFAPVGNHTRHEAEMMVSECLRRREWMLYAVTSCYHQKRAFLTLIKVLRDKGLDRQIGVLVTGVPCRDTVEDEKLSRYQDIDDVATDADAESYVDWWATCATS